MKPLIVTSGILCLALTLTSASRAQERQHQLLSTEEWADMMNRDAKAGLFYFRGAMDTLRAVGNFTCKTPVTMAQAAARISVDYQDKPEKVQRWFVFALMADLTRNHQCRFVDIDRLKYANQKLMEWEAEK